MSNLTLSETVIRTDESSVRFSTPLSSSGYLAVGVYLAILGLLNLAGNGRALLLFYRAKELRRIPEKLLLTNLSLCNLASYFVGYTPTTVSSFAGRYLFGDVFCVFQGFACFTLAVTAIDTLVMINIYKCIAICNPDFRKKMDSKATGKIIVAIWIYSLIWTIPPLFGLNRYTYEPFEISCSLDWTSDDLPDIIYKFTVCVTCFMVQVVILVYCFLAVNVKTGSSSFSKIKDANNTMTFEQAREVARVKKEMKLHNINIVTVVLFVGVWMPYAALSMWTNFADRKHLTAWITVTPTLFAKLSCAILPVHMFSSSRYLRRMMITSVKTTYGQVHPVQVRFKKTNETEKVDVFKDGVYIGQNIFADE